MPSAIIAISVGRTLNPNCGSMRTVIGTAIPISASDGIARARFATLTASRAPTGRVCPTHRPIGRAIARRDRAGAASAEREVLGHADRDPRRARSSAPGR